MGPLATLGFVWSESRGLIALAYLLGGLCMSFTAKSYAEMTAAVPSAGSVYGFARHALGPLPGFVAGWMILLDHLLIPSFLFVTVALAFGSLVPAVDHAVWIVLLVGFTTLVNWFGVAEQGGRWPADAARRAFPALQHPGLLVNDIREFFRPVAHVTRGDRSPDDYLPARVSMMRVPTAIMASRGTGWMVVSIWTS
jgi:amino acid transporter